MTTTRTLLTAALTLGLLAPASAQTLILNGKVSTDKTVVVGGKTYVPLNALQSLGIQVSTGSGVTSLTVGKAVASAPGTTTAASTPNNGAGGANQKASVTGCVNEWLFNGIWRLRVTKVEATTDPSGGTLPGYLVTAQVSNGTNKTLTLDQTGIQTGNAYSISFADGNSYNAPTSTSVRYQDKTWAKLLQGSGTLLTFFFFPNDGRTMAQAQANMPQKFLFEVIPSKLEKGLGVGFTVPDPSFRVDLTCKK